MLGPSVLDVGLIQDIEPSHEEKQIRSGRLVLKLGFDVVRRFNELQRLRISAHHEVAQVVGPARDEVMGVESTRHDVVEQQHGARNVAGKRLIRQGEVRVVVEHVQLFRDRLVREVLAGKGDELVKHGQGVAKGPVCFLGDDVERFFLGIHPLLRRDVLQVRHGVGHRDAVEVEDLAARQNRRENLVLLSGGQNEHRVRRRLLQCFQERVERRLAEHVHLVDDVHLVLPLLGRDAHLIHNAADVFDLVVGGCVQLKDVERHGLVLHVKPVDGAGKNPRRGRLAHPARATKEVGLRDLPRRNALLQGLGDARLPHHGVPSLGPIFAGTDEVGLVAHENANIAPPGVEGQTRLFTTRPHVWVHRCWFSESFNVLLRPIN